MATAPDNSHARWTRRAILAFVFLAPFLAFLLIRVNLVGRLATNFLSHVLLLAPTLVQNCQWLGPVMRSFETSEPEIWLTIDDGPSAAHTTALLDLLDR